jgi:hypothetical protein
MTTRERWKIYYRQLRIIRRETLKMTMDVMCYGRGYCEVGEHVTDFIRYIPFEDVNETPSYKNDPTYNLRRKDRS